MRRRAFITLVGGAAATWSSAVWAQSERVRRIGVLMPTTEDDSEGRARIAAFVHGLRDVGLTEGRNVKLDYRWAGSDVERLRTFASELLALTPDVLLADIGLPGMSGIEGVRLLHQRFPELPILMLTVHGDDDSIFAAVCAGAGAADSITRRTAATKVVMRFSMVHLLFR